MGDPREGTKVTSAGPKVFIYRSGTKYPDRARSVCTDYDIRPWGRVLLSSRVTSVSAIAEILHRVRRFGVPGAPRAAAVPADLVTEAEAELSLVFSLLEPYEREARTLVEDAARLADLTREDARQEVGRVKAGATRRAATVRAEASAARLAELDREVAQLLAGAEREAARITTTMAERLPQLTDQVVQRALALATADPPGPGRS